MLQATIQNRTRRVVAIFILAGVVGLLNILPATASQEVVLTWKRSPDSGVVGYHFYYGQASRSYNNSVLFGNVTNGTISGLLAGATYYFSAKTQISGGVESDFSNEAVYTVPLGAVNKFPTLQPIADLIINRDAGKQIINLAGISPGASGQNQKVTITASSSNPALIPNPTITYTSPSSTGTLSFNPAVGKFGVATVTVVVNNGGNSNNVISQCFTVSVLDSPNANPVLKSGSESKLAESVGKASPQYDQSPVSTEHNQIEITKESRRQPIAQSPRLAVQSQYAPYDNSKVQLATVPAPPIILTPIKNMLEGQFSFLVTGVTNDTYVIEATDDLVHWCPIRTNIAPFIFTETNAALLLRRYYRTSQPQS